jgi:adrenodoxin-NADP+ reductase
VHFHPVDPLLLPDPATISTFSRPQKRLLDLLTRASPTPPGSAKSFSLEFLLSPIAFEDRPNSRFSYKLEHIVFDRMALPPAPECWSPKARPRLAYPPGLEIINSKIAFRSIGYQSEPLPDFDALHIPFDERRGIIPNDGIGRVVAPSSSLVATNLPGFYCTGWVKSGPTGTIATTMMEAFNAADAIAEDWNSSNVAFLNGTRLNNSGDGAGWEGVKGEAAGLGLRRVSWEDWERIDSVEREMGGRMGKEREKFTSPEEMLAVLDK